MDKLDFWFIRGPFYNRFTVGFSLLRRQIYVQPYKTRLVVS